MAELIKFEVRRLPGICLVGKEIRHSMAEQMKGNNPLPAFWDECFAKGIFDPLEALADQVYEKGYVGVMLDWNKGDGIFSYVIGLLMENGVAVPEGYFSRAIEEGDAAIGWIQGADTADVCSAAHELTERALKEQGYSSGKMEWCMELYNCPRFTKPDENGMITLDYYIPLDKS